MLQQKIDPWYPTLPQQALASGKAELIRYFCVSVVWKLQSFAQIKYQKLQSFASVQYLLSWLIVDEGIMEIESNTA